MSHMTKLDGVADTDDIKPGMAFFAGTGPLDKTCGDCSLRGYYVESRKERYNERTQEFVRRSYRTTKCQMYRKLAGHHGGSVKSEYAACKYFEQKKTK